MMWGQKGGRSLITGNSIGAWLIRILIFTFLAGGTVLIAIRFLSARALAEEMKSAPSLSIGLGEAQTIDPSGPPDEAPLLSGALVMDDGEALPHAFAAGWKGRKVCETLFENNEMRAARCIFPPGAGHEKHWHGAHWGYIVAGAKMRTTDASGTVERDLKAGASWWSEGVAWHEALNIGATTGVYVIVEPKPAGAK